MKTNFILFLVVLFCNLILFGQTHNDLYGGTQTCSNATDEGSVNGGLCYLQIKIPQSCQIKATLHTSSLYGQKNFSNTTVTVNGGNTVAPLISGGNDYDLSRYIPVSSVELHGLYTSDPRFGWVTLTGVVTVVSSDLPMPDPPLVSSPVFYCKDATASPLTATVSTPVNILMWYTRGEGGISSLTAPVPSTAIVGESYYWVSQVNTDGCESSRSEINVTVSDDNWDTAITNNSDVLTVGQQDAVYQWLSCGGNGDYTNIPNANSQNYIVTAPGSYAVDVTINGCTKRSACYEVSSLGVADFEIQKSTKVYPNPVVDNVAIEFAFPDSDAKLNVYDITGRLMFSNDLENTVNTVNISRLTAGIYLFRISTEKGILTKQVMKK